MGEGERRNGEGGRCAPTALSQVGQTCNSSFAEQNNCIHGIINTQASFFSLVPKPPFFFFFFCSLVRVQCINKLGRSPDWNESITVLYQD